MAFDPKNDAWADFFALYSQQMGGLLRQDGQADMAAAADADAVRVMSDLAARDSGNASWQQDLAQSRLELSRLQLARKDTAGAATGASASKVSAERLLAASPGDRSLILLAAQADLVLGQVATEQKNGAAARQYWLQARDLIQPATRSGADPNFLAVYAEALLRLSQPGDARPVLAELNAMGYRTPDFVAVVKQGRLAYPVNAAFSRRIAQIMRNGDTDLPHPQSGGQLQGAAARP